MVQKYASEYEWFMVPSYLPYSSSPKWAGMLHKSHLEEYSVGILPATLIFPHIKERSSLTGVLRIPLELSSSSVM